MVGTRSDAKGRRRFSTHSVVLATALLFIAAVVAVWWFCLRSTPQDIVRRYLEASKAEDISKAEALVSSETLRLEDRLLQHLGAQKGPVSSVVSLVPLGYMNVDTIRLIDMTGDTATVRVTYVPKVPGQPGSTQDLKCVKQGRRWKIDFSELFRLALQMYNAEE